MSAEAARLFSNVILAEKKVRIKLLGDSITHGVGGTGFEQNGERILDEFDFKITLQQAFTRMNKKFIFVANIPASPENEMDGPDYWRIFHMDDVEMLYQKAAVQCGFPLIRLYTKFMEYCEMMRIHYTSLLADGLHPNDEGYTVMFKLILREPGIFM